MALPSMTYTLWVINAGSWYQLPDHSNLQFVDSYNEIPSISFSYPNSGINKSMLQQYYPEVMIKGEGVEFPNRRFYLEEYTERVAREGVNSDTVNDYTGVGVAIRTETILVYPPGGVTVSTLKTAGSNERTLGPIQGRSILRNLWSEAEARPGDATGIIDLIGATSGTDAFGSSWTTGGTVVPPNIIRSIGVGTTMKDVLLGLSNERHYDWYTVGRDIQIFRADDPTGRWTPNADVLLQLGVDVLQGDSKISLKQTQSTVLGEGKECRYYEMRNTGAETTYGFGRREKYVSFGASANDANLTSGTGMALTSAAALAEQRNYSIYPNGVNFNHNGVSRNYVGALPDADFRAGSFLRVKTSQLNGTTAGVLGATETMRVLAITYIVGDNGRLDRADLTMNTLFKSGEETLATADGQIINGDEILERSPNPVTVTDNTIVTTTSNTYVDSGTPVSVQFTVPPSGKVLVMICGELNNNTLARWTHLAFRISGTDTRAASDDDAIYIIANQTNPRLGITQLVTGLTPGGLDTVNLSHRIDSLGASTGSYTRRRITVIPI